MSNAFLQKLLLIITAFFGVAQAGTAQSHNTVISGTTAPEYYGKPAYLVHPTDPVSGNYTVVGQVMVDSNGYFRFELPIGQISLFKISIHSINASLLLEPGAQYDLYFPYLDKGQAWNISNRLEVAAIFTNPDTSGINYLTSDYNMRYYSFYSENAALLNNRKLMQKKVRQFTDSVSSVYQSIRNPYFQTFLECSNAELKLVNGFDRRMIYDSVIAKLPLSPQNIGWVSLMESFYGEYFQTFDLRFGGAMFFNRFNQTSNFEQVDSLLLKDDFLQELPLRHYVLLKSISENIHNTNFSASRLLETVQHLTLSQNSVIASIAKNLLEKYTERALNTPVPELQILDADSNTLQLRNQIHDKPTLLVFSAPWCVSCDNELRVIDSFKSEYGDVYNTVVLVLEDNFAAFEEYAEKVTVPAYNVVNTFSAKEKYQITSLPAFVLVDADGKLMDPYAPWPSNGLQALLHKWKYNAAEKERIKVGE